MNYFDRYQSSIKYQESDAYKEYDKFLHMFYNTNPKQMCPKCNKPGIIKKITDDGNIEMLCEACDWKVIIKPAEYINLYKTYSKKKQEDDILLYELLTTKDFLETKNKYLDQKKHVKQINEIFLEQENILNQLLSKKINTLSEFLILYYKRKEIFNKIHKPIPNRKMLMEIYNNEYKSIGESRINSIAKQLKVTPADIKNILLWIDFVHKYIRLQKEFDKINNEIIDYNNKIKHINDNLIINIPNITEGSKKVEPKIKQTEQPVERKIIKVKKSDMIPSSGEKKIKIKVIKK